ncbi:MAG: hypothetical protein EF813_02485 [Methanosarcinales archaeon]|nr:MAG: hypothetical protein EF813_02485 [Methanosarcinales archaeon]
MNIHQYESKIWATADLLRGSGIRESEWPSYMMPFFAFAMIESRESLADAFAHDIKSFIASLDYKKQPLVITTATAQY